MPENLENSTMATGLKKVSVHFNPKERQCQRMFKQSYNYAHFICQQGNAQNPSSQASTVCEPRNSRCTRWIQKRQRNQRPICQHLLDNRKSKSIPEKHLYLCFIDYYMKAFDCGSQLWKILKEMGMPDHLTCLLRNQYAGKEASQNWTWNNGLVQIGKGLCQGCILSPGLFKLYAQYIMQNAGLDES